MTFDGKYICSFSTLEDIFCSVCCFASLPCRTTARGSGLILYSMDVRAKQLRCFYFSLRGFRATSSSSLCSIKESGQMFQPFRNLKRRSLSITRLLPCRQIFWWTAREKSSPKICTETILRKSSKNYFQRKNMRISEAQKEMRA